MLRWVAVRIVMSLLLVGSTMALASEAPKAASDAAASGASKRKASRDGWPDTRAGERARQWVEAFSAGEDAMRAFLQTHMAESSVARRSVRERIVSYRKLRERFGSLVLGAVADATPSELKVTLLASDGSVHRFVFTVQTEPPYKLVSVGIRERGHRNHSGFGH